MNIANSSTTVQIKDPQSGGGLLSQLEDRVNHNLAQKDQASEAVNPQDVKSYISQISNQPVAGLNHSFVI